MLREERGEERRALTNEANGERAARGASAAQLYADTCLKQTWRFFSVRDSSLSVHQFTQNKPNLSCKSVQISRRSFGASGKDRSLNWREKKRAILRFTLQADMPVLRCSTVLKESSFKNHKYFSSYCPCGMSRPSKSSAIPSLILLHYHFTLKYVTQFFYMLFTIKIIPFSGK